MYNFNLSGLPFRTQKPRTSGINMVMDKGLSLRQAEDLIDVASNLIDFIKLGFGTSLPTNKLAEKIKAYQQANIDVYLGGTLFEAFLYRNALDDYQKLLNQLGITTAEVSDGSMDIEHDRKCEIIATLAKDFKVVSEVGSKDPNKTFETHEWIKLMKAELQAGSFKVIGEAREGGNVGIYQASGKANADLVIEIINAIGADNVIWEAPIKSQQIYFIKKLGANVNLGNIAPEEVIPLETLRLGLRGDTFFQFVGDNK